MMRKFAVALSLAGVLGASVVNALGLGEASVKSTLNQPLNAEIELVNIRGLDNTEILPGMASREEFLKAGVERIYFLSDIRFDVEIGPNGNAIVKLTTNKPVREPFLNFLVEVIWPSGRLLREYALLIDPPVYGDEPLAPVQQVVTAPSNLADSSASQGASPQVQSTPSESGESSEGGTYGPTTNQDTMWAIALKARPNASVSPQQTMLAIQDLNPDSFINSNINSLKKGQILRLPTLNEIRQRSKRDAVRGVIAQNRSFEDRKLGKNVVDATTEEPSKDQAPAALAETAKPGDELKLVVEDSAMSDQEMGTHAGDKGAVKTEALENNLAITLEKLDQSNLERNELGGRVKDLESQLETLQRLLTLKDDQLATLQSQMGKAPEVEGVVTEEIVVTEEAVVVPDGTVVDEVVETEVVETVAAEDGVAEGDVAEGDPLTVGDEVVEAEVVTESEPLKTVDTKAVAPAPVSAPVKAEAEQADVNKPISQNILQMVLNNPLYQALTGGVVLLVLVIVWLLSRKNAQREQDLLTTEDGSPEDSNEFFEDLTEDENLVSEDESSEKGDASEDQAPLQSETDDVIAEADIYIAYGRLDQASQLLENAISSEPQRTDTRIKLLEVYAEANESESFAKQFSEIEALNDEDAFASAVAIKDGFSGSDISVSIDDLESQLLEGDDDVESGLAPIEYDTSEAPSDVTEDSEVTLEVEGSNEDSLAEASEAVEATHDDLDIEFDISEIDLSADEATSEDEAAALDFDLSDADLDAVDTVDTVELEAEVAEDELLETDALALDDEFKLDTAEEEVEEEILDLNVDFDDIDSDLGIASDELEAVDEGAEEILDLELDTDLDLDSDVVAGLDVDSAIESNAIEELDVELSDEFDLELASEEAEAEASLEEIGEGELNLDDLDLELDKIDSELDVDFGLEEESTEVSDIDIEDVDAAEVKVEDVSAASDDDLEGIELEDFEALQDEADAADEVEVESLDIDDALDESVAKSDSVVEELEDIASALTSDEEAEEQNLDDSLIESAEDAMAELGEFEAELAEDEDFDFLAGTDEAATKLDLARAYIDMGDSDGAKDILEEVALEGSEAQKLEAQELIKTLD